MPGIEPALVALAHAYFQEHVPDGAVPELCMCLRPYPCSNRSWAISYLVAAGRLVLPRGTNPSDSK